MLNSNGILTSISRINVINVKIEFNIYLQFVCFVALCSMSKAMVMARRSVHLTTLFPGQA